MIQLLSKIAFPMLIALVGLIAGIGLQQRVLSRKEIVKVDYDKVRELVAQELQKLPKPEPSQSIDIDKIRGKGAKVDLHQHYHIEMNGDSLVMKNIKMVVSDVVSDELSRLKISRCK